MVPGKLEDPTGPGDLEALPGPGRTCRQGRQKKYESESLDDRDSVWQIREPAPRSYPDALSKSKQLNLYPLYASLFYAEDRKPH
jgi:hypothetical protein